MRAIVAALGLAALAAAAAGCLGAAAPTTPTERTGVPTLPPAPAATSVVVRYVVGGRAATAPALLAGDCPALARCRAVRIPGTRPRRWELVARRTLTCGPNRGAYAHPAAACRALRDLARLEAHRGPNVCMCPMAPLPPPTAVGRIDRRHVSFALGPCAACGLGGHAFADMRILVPT